MKQIQSYGRETRLLHWDHSASPTMECSLTAKICRLSGACTELLRNNGRTESPCVYNDIMDQLLSSTSMPPLLYPGANCGIPRTRSANVTNLAHVTCETHPRKAPPIEHVSILLYVLHGRESWRAAPIRLMINTACTTVHRSFVIAEPIGRHAKKKEK